MRIHKPPQPIHVLHTLGLSIAARRLVMGLQRLEIAR